MALEFNCPNGHRIVCQEDLAGRDAKCPKCGVAFRIPNSSGEIAVKLAGLAGGPVPVTATGAPGESSLNNLGAPRPLPENSIVFLCPNGHRLNGPARLQGQAGQCPHCGAKFLVPIISETEQVEEVDLASIADRELGPLDAGVDPATMRQSAHSLCQLMRKLWEEKQQGAVIELHLEGGAMLVPDWFDERLSRQSHGLFASQAADGTVTMTVVAWDQVSRVVVRNVEGLPEGMFE
jgi:DNA-directed RNA polymerase subunit RPC12/RpoP